MGRTDTATETGMDEEKMKVFSIKSIRIVTALAVIGVIVVVGSLIFLKKHREAQHLKCLHNLVLIDHAINCGIPMSKGLSLGEEVRTEDVIENCLGELPQCPSGGKYVIDYHVGKHPVCPKHSDLTRVVETWVHHPKVDSTEQSPNVRPTE